MPLRVLLIEDEATLRYLERAALEEEGCEVREAEHGAEALKVLAEWQPQVIVLDSAMPVMDAAEFREEQRARGLAEDVPVLLVSGRPDADDLAATLGAKSVCAKPFDLDEFASAVLRLGAPPEDDAELDPRRG